MLYEEALAYLDKVSASGSIMGLDSIRALTNELGNPQDDLKVIHIAGTNGKGSILNYTSNILTDAGYKVGVYSSPSVLGYLERFQISGKWMKEEELPPLVEKVKAAADRMAEKGLAYPTVFELETAVAFLYFKESACDYAVIECGMGGELDSTNIIKKPLVCAFAAISLDHVGILGSTIEEIAETKSGIIKPGASVVTGWQKQEAEAVLRKKAEKTGTEIIEVQKGMLVRGDTGGGTGGSGAGGRFDGQRFSYKEHKDLYIKLLGKHQIENAAVAIDIIDALKKKGAVINEDNIRSGLENAVWPGRFEIIKKTGGQVFVVDGAHNEDASKRLAESLDEYFGEEKLEAVMGIFRDKDYRTVIKNLAPHLKKVYTIDLPDKKRNFGKENLAEELKSVNIDAEPAESLKAAIDKANGNVLVTGSLSYLGEARKCIAERKRKVDKEKIMKAVTMMLEGIGEDPGREGLRDTPDRIARMCEEIFGGMGQTAETHLTKVFACENSEMVMEKDISFYSMCEHHMVPFFGKVHIAYIPDGKVVGLSKLARTVEVYARRLQIQEKMTTQIADDIMKYLEPKGVMVVCEAEHMCMTMRGVKKPGTKTVNIVTRGCFENDESLKNLFFRMLEVGN